MKSSSLLAATLALCQAAPAQLPPGITPEMINTTLPEEGAPKATPGPHVVIAEPAFGAPSLVTFRPAQLEQLPRQEKLPVLVWVHGGCAINNPRFYPFLETIASHGFLVVTTASAEAPAPGTRPRSATADDMKAGIDWAERENAREDSPLRGRIDTTQIAASGQSCGGTLSIGFNTTEPRVNTTIVFNGGVEPPNPNAPPADRPTTESLPRLHGTVLLVDGAERDFATPRSRSTFDALGLPAFYASRRGGGHLLTFYHPGGGEMANVASSWLRWQLKGNKDAAQTFVGVLCGLCTDPNWDTASKQLVHGQEVRP